MECDYPFLCIIIFKHDIKESFYEEQEVCESIVGPRGPAGPRGPPVSIWN